MSAVTISTRKARDLAQIALELSDVEDVGTRELARAVNELADQVDALGGAYERGYQAAGVDAVDRILEDVHGPNWRAELPELAAARRARENSQ